MNQKEVYNRLMKRIVLCDAGDYKKVTELCIKYSLGVNIDVSTPEYYLMYNPNEINEIIEGYRNVEIFSVNGSFEDLNFWSADELIREVTTKRYEYAYEISCKLKCRNIVLPNGCGPSAIYHPSLYVGTMVWKDFLKNKDKESIFYIKNVLDHSPVILNELINIVDKDNLKMCFDIGYANTHSKIKITEWIEKVNKNIGFVKLYNNNGEANEHNGLNNGKINMIEICTALEQYCPNAIWEIETAEYEDSINWLNENKYIK